MQDFMGWSANAIALAALVYAIYSTRQKAAAHKVAAIDHNLGEVADRVTRLESDMRHLPDKDVTHRIELTMATMKTELGVIAERIKPIAAISDRLQEAMIELAERSSRA